MNIRLSARWRPGSWRRKGCRDPRGPGGPCSPGCVALMPLWRCSTPPEPEVEPSAAPSLLAPPATTHPHIFITKGGPVLRVSTSCEVVIWTTCNHPPTHHHHSMGVHRYPGKTGGKPHRRSETHSENSSMHAVHVFQSFYGACLQSCQGICAMQTALCLAWQLGFAQKV